ncbi:MAG: hypothetical protein H2038_10340 [Brevundimonas sp.]|uniref:hypothetical protein n=1 Tax=Brevundimonas sp. TaxID=1871086 RepID=UPI0017D98F3E|nr:hypothetical protein [Brevundimonas sp.]MBA4805038.1 hypothetical protein [Brevundimonas sp.]
METPAEGPGGLAREPERRAGLAPVPERRPYAQPYDSLAFTVVSRAARELTITLAAQPVFDLGRSAPVARRVRRTVRHAGGERALRPGGRTLETGDLHRIDALTLREGLAMLRPGPSDSGILPAYWRTVASSRGRFARLCAELQHARAPGSLLIEVVGGMEQAPPGAVADVIGHFETAAQGVILHLAPDPATVARAAGVGARCLALDFAGVAHEHASDWRSAAELIAAARAACGQVLLLNLRPDRGLAARSAGATHAVFAGMEPVLV